MSTAHHIGAVALIDVGTEVWTDKRHNADGDGLGGVVVATEVRQASEDDPTPVRHFLTMDPYRTGRTGQLHVTFRRLAESEIDPDSVVPADSSRLANLVRRLCEEVAFTSAGRPRKGLFTPDQAEWVSYAHRLTAVLMGGGRP